MPVDRARPGIQLRLGVNRTSLGFLSVREPKIARICGEHDAPGLEIHSPFRTPANCGYVEKVAIGIRAATLGVGGFALFGRAIGVDFVDEL